VDIEHFFIEKGQGEPLILLHGNGENCDYFKGQIDEFARKSLEAKQNAEMLGLMVNDPNVQPAELSAIKAKTLVIAGTNDMIKDAHTRLIAQSIPDSQLVLIKGNHFIANKCPEAFNRAVLGFLNS
jgi:pimeloyl-ACP methyl ester carboxylesterase